MDDPISPARRTLLKAGAATLATPVAAAIAQPAAAVGHQEAKSFDLWVISDQHVGTDKAASEGILHGLVGFRPPPVRAESLATALRQSEEGGAFGGLSFNWDIALNLGDYAGFWDAPEDEQGREVVRQYSVLKKHRREQVYNIAGNHDASPHGHPANEGKETNWWFRKWCDPVGEHMETSGVDPNKRPYPIDGTWERYTFKVGNIRFLMMGDRNDLPYPVGRRASGGASPAGAVTPETFAWWTSHVESAGKDEIIITGAHHMLRETTVGSGDYEGVSRNPDGTFRSGRYHGPDGAPEGASYLYFLGDKPKAQAFENYLAAHPGAIDLWVGGHTHTRRRAQRPFACGAQMGRQFRQLRAAVEIPLLRDLPAHEPALHLHGGLAARARALLPARRHACGGRLVLAGRARARVFEAVLLELSVCS
jgi:hypothetical protein